MREIMVPLAIMSELRVTEGFSSLTLTSPESQGGAENADNHEGEHGNCETN
jgi:hypothetical protein